MATSQAAHKAELALGHSGHPILQQDIANTFSSTAGDPSSTMKALVWRGKQKVSVVTMPKPKLVEPGDVILRVTGTTVCGSDLHLLHGAVLQMQVDDVLGHEFCGVVESVGTDVKKVKEGKRYVASFQIACGDVSSLFTPPRAKRGPGVCGRSQPGYHGLLVTGGQPPDPRSSLRS